MIDKINSKAYVLMHDNIDTDQIIPAKFLKATDRIGFGKHLFANWRYDKNGKESYDFPITTKQQGNSILIAGNNFGCGSSREHAAWALIDYGIKAIVSSEFADIFKGNAYNNGILPIQLNTKQVLALLAELNISQEIQINLEDQTISSGTIKFPFEIPALKKQLLLSGTTETEYLINMRDEIADFEQARSIINL